MHVTMWGLQRGQQGRQGRYMQQNSRFWSFLACHPANTKRAETTWGSDRTQQQNESRMKRLYNK